MANSPQLETYKLFYEQLPVIKPAIKKSVRKSRFPQAGRSLLETPAK